MDKKEQQTLEKFTKIAATDLKAVVTKAEKTKTQKPSKIDIKDNKKPKNPTQN